MRNDQFNVQTINLMAMQGAHHIVDYSERKYRNEIQRWHNELTAQKNAKKIILISDLLPLERRQLPSCSVRSWSIWG